MANPLAGEVPFPIAGEGMCFKFTLGDLAEMAARYGHPSQTPKEAEDAFWSKIMNGIFTNDPVVMMDLLRYGLKKEGRPSERADQKFIADPPFAMSEIAKPALNALFLRRDGKSYDQQVDERAKELEAEEERLREGFPPQTPVQESASPVSTGSSAPDTAQG